MQIELDFELFKALTALRENEEDSYSDVIRRLLVGKSNTVNVQSGPVKNLGFLFNDDLATSGEVEAALRMKSIFQPRKALLERNAFSSRGLVLPDGTLLKASYKGAVYEAKIQNGKWIDHKGQWQSSPSAAASAITGNNVNGLRFWIAKRPGDNSWWRLDVLAAAS